MKEQEPDLTQRIAGRIRELRADQKLSLGCSRSGEPLDDLVHRTR